MDCASATWDRHTRGSNTWYGNFAQNWKADSALLTDRYTTDFRFAAGGGVYLLKIEAGVGNPFTVAVEREAGVARSGLLPAGGVAIRLIAGSASTTDASGETRRAGETWKDCPNCPSMVAVPAGSFMMGSPATEPGRLGSEGPRHVVTIGQPFAMGRYEVTFEEYDACVGDGACPAVNDGGWWRGRRPAVNLAVGHAQAYVSWLSRTSGQSYFIPSEAEWEYVARAGTSTPWNTGAAVIADDANILNQFGKTVVVGGYAPNAFGLYDTIGNVAEWTQDCMDTGYVGAPTDGSAATSGDCDGQTAVRGGHFASAPTAVRSASRQPTPRAQSSNETGLRVARAL
ncbi:formylglycine-generating enzyme family protein [Brevundimonas goettingensis]|uniref:Formylglycine-generating enzyme family protein n=1 Tax=Brevundimonas goettingensis TaxID=2774190 RepID=A0A975GX49_9CAUL|nr:formylglycine-generating enzyme family protein [Brevundimonas goettingensis]QTC90160.1 formylglycine-generating enzyme family protein [Brevundimonas goettingensis]